MVVWFLADGGRIFSQVRVVCIEGVHVGGLTSPKLERAWVWAVLGVPVLGVPALDVAAVVRFRWCWLPVRSSWLSNRAIARMHTGEQMVDSSTPSRANVVPAL